jgi:hypothetical protein
MYQVTVNDHGIAICNTTFYECHYFNQRNSIDAFGNFEYKELRQLVFNIVRMFLITEYAVGNKNYL